MSIQDTYEAPAVAPKAAAQPIPARVPYPIPLNEDARLSALHALKILDTPADERFERIVRLAAAHFGTPMVRITFVDRDRTWYKACIGLQASEGPRDIAICSHTVMQDEVLVSRDLSKDPNFSSAPQVVGGPKFRFYAGAPIVLEDGMRVGSLCIIDIEAHPDFSTDDCEFLADLAKIVVHELELRQQIINRDANLEDAHKEIAVARGAQKRFLDIISHELKTPLAHVLGFGKLLAEQSLGPLGNDDYVDYARTLHLSAERLDGLISRVLTYSSAQTGELRLHEETLAIDALMQNSLELVRLSGKTAKVDVNLTIDPDASASVFADAVQISEIIVQLLENAIAFSPPGASVELNICRDQNGGISMRVIDRGPGIKPDLLENAMQEFSQCEQTINRHHEGIGLGLPMVRAILELHGGVLSLTNRQGGGMIAEATLPARRNRAQ